MPRWKSILHEPARDTFGGPGAAGEVVWVPQDDSAKAAPLSDRAAELVDKEGNPYYKRKTPDERLKIRRMLRERELRHAGLLPQRQW